MVENLSKFQNDESKPIQLKSYKQIKNRFRRNTVMKDMDSDPIFKREGKGLQTGILKLIGKSKKKDYESVDLNKLHRTLEMSVMQQKKENSKSSRLIKLLCMGKKS